MPNGELLAFEWDDKSNLLFDNSFLFAIDAG